MLMVTTSYSLPGVQEMSRMASVWPLRIRVHSIGQL